MYQLSDLYASILTLSALLSAVAISLIWKRRAARGGVPLILLMASAFIWSSTYAVHWFLVDSPSRLFWLDATYVGVVSVPACFFVFLLTYTQRDRWLNKQTYLLLAIEPVITLLLLFTDKYHGLFFAGKRLATSSDIFEGGPGFWINIVYSYGLILLSLAMVIQLFIQARKPFKRQAGLLLAGALLPLLGNLVGLVGIKAPGLDLTPLMFTVTALIFTNGLLNVGLLDLIPVARSTLIEKVSDGVFVLDDQNRIVDINQVATKLLGLEDDEPLGMAIEDVLKDQPEIIERFRGLNEEQAEIEINSDPPHYYEVQIIPLGKRHDQPTGHLVTCHDITARKMTDIEREKMIRELDSYAHTVAHELKTPLSVTIGYLDLLKQDQIAGGNPSALYLEEMEKSSFQMLNIIDELLLLAGIRGKQEIPLKIIDMESLVSRAIMRTRYIHEGSDPEIILPEEWPQVIGYDPWIEQVWVNYLTNARKYGGDPLRIEIGAEVITGGMARFSVTDNGKGVPTDQQARLFQQFERLNEYIDAKGHGLGLSIVRRIIARLGGEAGVESAPGKGATFYFTLPTMNGKKRSP